jgi:hypothetical protein
MPKSKLLKKVKRQTGHSITAFDKLRHAMPPGWRISNTGHKYYENRKNRSDLGRWL